MSDDDLLERWAEAEGLIDELLELPLDARRSRVRETCETNPHLRPLLEPLVGDDLEHLPFPAPPLELLEGALAEARSAPAEIEALPSRVGPYAVLGELGHGGMGRVLLARHAGDADAPRVALKLLDSRECAGDGVRRFERERQTLARLEHANIARLHDGGVTTEGVPYLVMELVDGVPLDRYCDREALDVRSRVRLFQQVSAAVEYAHGRLVVHRDLKPANILVTDRAEVKLLDFGIAKWLEALDAAEVLTRTRQRVLTLSYAAPEQLRGDAVTPATDVYQLGLLLYELLAGLRAHGQRDAGPAALRRALEREPDPPSRAVLEADGNRIESGSTVHDFAACRGASVAGLSLSLRGALDAIVLKALRNAPGARYPTVAALRTDLDNYLAHRPVAATRGARMYRWRTYAARRLRESGVLPRWRRRGPD
jgi:serine/threonine protein kinase